MVPAASAAREQGDRDMGKKEDRLWNEGFEAACRVAERNGLEGLKAERRFRGVTGLMTRMTASEIDERSDDIKHLLFGTLRIAFVSVLHDDFGFGKQRIQKFLYKCDKFAEYLDHGWISWIDVIESIKESTGVNLMIEDGDQHFYHWQRPEAQDMYSEADLIEKEAWTARIDFLGLVDDGKGEVKTKDGGWCWKYGNQYDKIQIYDELGGIALAVNVLGASKPGEEKGND